MMVTDLASCERYCDFLESLAANFEVRMLQRTKHLNASRNALRHHVSKLSGVDISEWPFRLVEQYADLILASKQ